jgi:hypothetical protein
LPRLRCGNAPGQSGAQRATLEPVAISMAITLAESTRAPLKSPLEIRAEIPLLMWKKVWEYPRGRNSSYSHGQNQSGREGSSFRKLFWKCPVTAMYSIYPVLKKKSLRLATLPPCRERVCSTRCELGSGREETSDTPDEPDDSTPMMW